MRTERMVSVCFENSTHYNVIIEARAAGDVNTPYH